MSKSKNKPKQSKHDQAGILMDKQQNIYNILNVHNIQNPKNLTLISPQRDDMKLIKDTKLSLNGKCDVLWQSHDIVQIYLNPIYRLLIKRKHIIFAPLWGEEECCFFSWLPMLWISCSEILHVKSYHDILEMKQPKNCWAKAWARQRRVTGVWSMIIALWSRFVLGRRKKALVKNWNWDNKDE